MLRGAAYDPLKRAIDVVVGVAALVLSLPVQAAVALLVRLRLGSPVLFRQARPGKDEKIFELVKFRTMRDVDVAAGLVSDSDRMTELGSFLRATSVDELPTLWNVAKGDMSLVGPRPLLPQYLDRYSLRQRRRHEVRPGITGLAQVRGRNAIGWEVKLELDVQYVEERSLWLDLRVVRATLLTVLGRHGIASDGYTTMPEFKGNADRP